MIDTTPSNSPQQDVNHLKRSSPADGFEQPLAKRVKYEVDTAVAKERYDEISRNTYNPIQWPIEQPITQLDYYQQHIIAFYEQNKERGFPPELLRESYPLIVGFCVHFKIFGISLPEYPTLLIRTTLCILASLVQSGNSHCSMNSIVPSSGLTVEESSLILDKIIRQEEYSFGDVHNILSVFVDYASVHGLFESTEYTEWINILTNRDIDVVENCLLKLNVLGLPESLYDQAHPLLPTVILLMFCQITKVPADNFTNHERLTHSLFSKICGVVLGDMFNWTDDIKSNLSNELINAIAMVSV